MQAWRPDRRRPSPLAATPSSKAEAPIANSSSNGAPVWARALDEGAAAGVAAWAAAGAVEASETGTAVGAGSGHREVAVPLSAPSIPHRVMGRVTPFPGLPEVPMPVVVAPGPVIGPDGESGSVVRGARGFDSVWLSDEVGIVANSDGVTDGVIGTATEFTVLVTVGAIFCTVDCAGYVAGTGTGGGGTGVGMGMAVGVGMGSVAPPAGNVPATDPAANITPTVTPPAAIARRFGLMSAPPV